MSVNKQEIKQFRHDDKGELVEIASVWHIDDVFQQAECEDVDITRAQAREVLRLLVYKHDASIGINWDTISHWMNYVLDEEGE